MDQLNHNFMLMKKIYKWREKKTNERNLVTLTNEILITNDKS